MTCRLPTDILKDSEYNRSVCIVRISSFLGLAALPYSLLFTYVDIFLDNLSHGNIYTKGYLVMYSTVNIRFLKGSLWEQQKSSLNRKCSLNLSMDVSIESNRDVHDLSTLVYFFILGK